VDGVEESEESEDSEDSASRAAAASATRVFDRSPRSARRESTIATVPPRRAAATGAGTNVRRTTVAATNITVDQDATDVANGTDARFHGSSESGITTKT
jgi:hypothetical protein